MDSPRSEKSQTRYSTPVSDLDDHRRQPVSMPRADFFGTPRGPGTRRNTVEDTDAGQSVLLEVNNDLLRAGSIPRDFENDVIDDDRSGKDEKGLGQHETSAPVSRRGTCRRCQAPSDPITRVRASSPDSRSDSPPNSVDAFAESRRRERSNTLRSKVPSERDLSLHRTVSKGTHRLTFTNGSIHSAKDNEDGGSNADAEDDICFPVPEEPSKHWRIDFEDLEEFVALNRRGQGHLQGRSRHLSFSSSTSKPRLYAASTKIRSDLPQILTESPSPSLKGSDGVETTKFVLDKQSINEKCEDHLCEKGPVQRRSSVAEPNRFNFFSSELPQSIHAADLEDLVMPGESFRDLFELPSDGGCWWLDVVNPTKDELTAFEKAFHIHRLTIEDIETQENREKVELFRQYYFVCFRSFSQLDKTSEHYMEPLNVYMVVFREGIITVTYDVSPHAAYVRKRIGKLRDYMSLNPDWICYAYIDHIVDSFAPVITSIEIETDAIEDQVFVTRDEDFSPLLRQIGECRKKVMSLMRLLGGKADVIKGFAKRCNESYSVTPRGEIGLYLGDIQDHVVTMMSNLGHFEKMLSRSHSNHLAQLSVDHMAQGNRANKVLSKITLLASILVPLNLICGLFGMNVPVPGRETTGLGWFFGILGVILLFVAFCLGVARRYRFI